MLVAATYIETGRPEGTLGLPDTALCANRKSYFHRQRRCATIQAAVLAHQTVHGYRKQHCAMRNHVLHIDQTRFSPD